jgi:hypothetical protein
MAATGHVVESKKQPLNSDDSPVVISRLSSLPRLCRLDAATFR